jgi:F0F1-type ATP synthase membrane subunit b/b'
MIQKRLAGIDGEIKDLRTRAQAEMANEAARLKAETERLLQRAEQQTKQELEFMTKAAKHELKGFSADLALGMAEQRIRALLSPASQDTLANAFIKDLHDGAEHRSMTQ